MATFSDFYKQQASGLGSTPQVPVVTTPPAAHFDLGLKSQAQQVGDQIMSPINWAIDMLSRPLYGTTNAIQGGIDQGVQAKQAFDAGDTGAGIANVAGATLGAVPRFLEGFFNLTNDPTIKRTYSDVLEQSTDKIGKAVDPGYQDVQDNVNPVLKGIGGFALDIVGDPLTWIPGLDVAKVATGIKGGIDVARGLAKGATGAEDVVAGVKDLAKAKVADEAAIPNTTLPDNPGLDIPMKPVAPEVPTPAAGVTPFYKEVGAGGAGYKPLSSFGYQETSFEDLMKTVPQAAPQKSFKELVTGSDRGQKIKSEIADLHAAVGKATAPLSKAEWFKQSRNEVPKITNEQERNIIGVKNPSYEKLNQLLKAEGQAHRGQVTPRAVALKAVLDRGYDTHVANQTQVFAHVQDAFAAKVAQDQERMQNIFGDRLLTHLQSKNTPRSFAREMTLLNKAFDPTTNLETFAGANKQLIASIRDTLQIPDHIGVVANDAEKLARAADAQAGAEAAFGKAHDVFTPGTAGHAEKYPVQHGNTSFTAGTRETRTGSVDDQWNSFKQYSLEKESKKLIDAKRAELAGEKPVYGEKSAKLYREAHQAVMSDVADVAAINGHQLHIGFGKQELLPLSVDQVKKAVNDQFKDDSTALLALWNYGSAVSTTPLLQTVHAAMMAGDLEALGAKGVRALHRELVAGLEGKVGMGETKKLLGQDIPSNIKEANARGYNYATKAQAEKAAEALHGRVVKTVSKETGNPGYHVVFDAKQLIPELVTAILKAQPELVAKAATNKMGAVDRMADEASKLSNDMVSKISNSIDNGVPASDVMNSVIRTNEDIGKAAEDIRAMQGSVDVARTTAKLSMGESLAKDGSIFSTLKTDLRQEASALKDSIDVSTQKRINQGVDEMVPEKPFSEVETFPETEAAAKGAVKTKPKTKKYDIGSMDEADTLQHVVGKLLPGWLHRSFNYRYGAERAIELQLAGRSMANQFLGEFSHGLTQLARQYPKGDKTLQEAWQALQRGDTPEHLAEPMAQLEALVGQLLPVKRGGDSYIDMPMLHTDGDIANINDALRMSFGRTYPTVPELNLDTAIETAVEEARALGKKKAKPPADAVAEALSQQWRTWDVTDPLDFLSRLSNATATVIERKAVMGEFVKRFTDQGLLSSKPRQGFVKVVDSTGQSAYRSYLPKNLYADPGLAGELHRLDFLVRTPKNIEGSLGHFLRTYFMPVQNAWKRDITVMRPGHHVRNFIGDSSITWMSRGNRHFGSSYNDSQKVLGWKNNYSHADINAALTRARNGDWTLPEGGETIASGKVGGKPFKLTTESTHAALSQLGLLSDYRRAEDLLNDALEGSGRVAKLSKLASFEGTKIGDFAGGVSEYTAHMGRAQHFIQAMKQELSGKGKFKGVKTPEELMQKVADEVRRAHPDGAMLTPFEHKYMRVLMPFYSWFSKTLPYAFETAMRHPGRFMAFPKASYDAAVAAGVNPDSLSDPFPTDQLFPSFLTGGVFGPQFQTADGQYINVNPGFAPTDILNTVGQGPVKGFLGMVSPLIRTPIELATGTNLTTGAPIKDTSDYLDQQLPGINYLANVTGISPTGTIASLLSGNGVDQQAQVAAGNKGALDQGLSAANFLTGLNIQNWSRPNFINYAEIEKRNQAAAAAGGKP